MVGTTGTTRTCQRVGCSKYLHHVCSIEWVLKNKLPEGGIATLCRAHHPHYTKFVAAAAAAAASTASNSITGGVISPTCPTASMDLTDILNGASGIPRANDYEEPPPSLCVSPAENHFIDNNRTMLSLAAMCIGALDNDGLQLVDPDAAPWNQFPKKQVKPASDILRAEMMRRWTTSAISDQEGKPPASKNWGKDKLMKWLHDYPIAATDDVAFLKREVASRKKAAINAAQERDKEAAKLLALDGEGAKNKYKSWNGRLPYLRLIHTLIDHDNIKAAYIRRGDIPSGRMAVENRNTKEAKEASVWQMMADKWNDHSFTPATASEPDWHPHYTSSETITFEMVSEFLPPDAVRVKERFESMMTVLKRQIPKWERSGQGDGGHHGDDEDEPGFGVLAGRSSFSLSKVQDFFENNNSYVIYLWHMIAKHQLIKSSMNMLAAGVGSRSGASGIPCAISTRTNGEDDNDGGSSAASRTSSTISSARKKNDGDGDVLSESIREHATRIHDFALAKKEATRKTIEHARQKEKRKRYDTIQLEIGRLRAEKRQLLIQKCTLTLDKNDDLTNALAESIAEVEEEISTYTKQLSEVDMQTPQKSNRSPPDC